MKKHTEKQSKRAVSAFATEADEAKWWFKRRMIQGERLLDAMNTGEAQVSTREKLRERIAASHKAPSPVVSLRIPEADLA